MGLIGWEVSIAFALQAGANTVILDIEQAKGEELEAKLEQKGFEANFRKFDCAELDQIDEAFSDLINDYGAPDIFINASYPRTCDWVKNSFQEVTRGIFS